MRHSHHGPPGTVRFVQILLAAAAVASMIICGGALAATPDEERDSGNGLVLVSGASSGSNLMTGNTDNLGVTWGRATGVSASDANDGLFIMTPELIMTGGTEKNDGTAVTFTRNFKVPVDGDFTMTPDPGGSLLTTDYPNSDVSEGEVGNSPPAARGILTAHEDTTAAALTLVKEIAITTDSNKNPTRMEAVRVPTEIPVGP